MTNKVCSMTRSLITKSLSNLTSSDQTSYFRSQDYHSTPQTLDFLREYLPLNPLSASIVSVMATTETLWSSRSKKCRQSNALPHTKWQYPRQWPFQLSNRQSPPQKLPIRIFKKRKATRKFWYRTKTQTEWTRSSNASPVASTSPSCATSRTMSARTRV